MRWPFSRLRRAPRRWIAVPIGLGVVVVGYVAWSAGIHFVGGLLVAFGLLITLAGFSHVEPPVGPPGG